MYDNTKNVPYYLFGKNSINQLGEIIERKFTGLSVCKLFILDCFFKGHAIIEKLPVEGEDICLFVDTKDEPKTDDIDAYVDKIQNEAHEKPECIIGIGGGSALDVAKAVSNRLNNPGRTEDYQGWDLVKNRGVYKIGIPTLSGTGAEVSRTCVLTNPAKNMKLGMNSDYSLFDQIILDPVLTESVSPEQYFYTGMDTYMHCFETLRGRYRNVIVDSLAEKAISLTKEVFLSGDMMSEDNREKMMIASYIGGTAAGNVGLVHPVSAGLSIVLGLHHGIANCYALEALEAYYPEEFAEYQEMKRHNCISLQKGVCSSLTDSDVDRMFNSIIIHGKPLKNALGENYREMLTKDELTRLLERM